MNEVDMSVPRGVRFSNFTTLESGEVEADIEIDEEFRLALFDKLGWIDGNDEDEAKFNEYVNYCFQMMLHKMKERRGLVDGDGQAE